MFKWGYLHYTRDKQWSPRNWSFILCSQYIFCLASGKAEGSLCPNRLLLVAINLTTMNGNVGVSYNLFHAAKTTRVCFNSDYDRVGVSTKENKP